MSGRSKNRSRVVRASAAKREATAAADLAFALVVACTDRPLDDARKARIVAAYEALGGETQALLEQVRRHQVATIVAHGLAAANCAVPAALAQLAAAVARHALRQAGESVRLLAQLEAHGINAIAIKGPLLSHVLHNDVTLRQCSDIDLMVDWEQFEAAITVLRTCGYDLVGHAPPFGDWRITPWRRLSKDLTLVHPGRHTTIELHHRLIQLPDLLPDLGVEQAVVPLELAERTLRRFSDADLFVYLCVHAAASPRHRLKWLVDLRVLLARSDRATIAAWQSHSVSLSTGRCTALGMLLVDHVWGQDLPESVTRAALEDRNLARLLAAAIRRFHGAELTMGSLAYTKQRLTGMLLRDDLTYRAAFISFIFRDKEVLERFALARGLRWLYLPLRLILFLQRKATLLRKP